MTVAACGGFREAAARLGLSQPTITQHVKRLEKALNAELIIRNNAGSTLTAAGKAFLPYAENLMRTCESASALFVKKSFVVGASSNTGIYLLQPYLKAYQCESPHAFGVIIGDNPSIADKLERFEVDIAIMEWWDNRAGFSAHVWRREELVVIVPPHHPWSKKDGVSLHCLKGQSLLGGEGGSGTGHLLRQYLDDDAETVTVSMQLGSTEAVKHAVRAGLGISLVMAKSVEQEKANGSLCVLPIMDHQPVKNIYAVYRETGLPDAPASHFARFLLSCTAL